MSNFIYRFLYWLFPRTKSDIQNDIKEKLLDNANHIPKNFECFLDLYETSEKITIIKDVRVKINER